MFRHILLRTNYFHWLCCILHKALASAHARLKSSKSTSLICLGSLSGKIVTSGQGDFVTELLLKVIRDGTVDFIWRRIAQQLFKNIPVRAYETLLLNLLCALEDGQLLTHLLGTTCDDPNVLLVLTQRLLFNRIVSPPRDVRKKLIVRNGMKFYFLLIFRNLFALSVDWSIDWSIVWLISWTLDWLIDWLIDFSIVSLIDWLIDRLIDWLIDWLLVLPYVLHRALVSFSSGDLIPEYICIFMCSWRWSCKT